MMTNMNLIAVVQWHVDREVAAAVRRTESELDDSALEEMRRWKAKSAELDFKREIGEFKHVDQVRAAFSILVGPLGNAIKAIQKQFGDDAAQILQDALEQADEAFNRVLEPEAEGG